MEEKTLRWRIGLDKTYGAFLLGANINIGFRVLVIGKDLFGKEGENNDTR